MPPCPAFCIVTFSMITFLPPTDIADYKGLISVTQDSTAPTEGTWAKGSIVYNTAPTAGGYAGWVCTVAGTPGTWKGFGSIEA